METTELTREKHRPTARSGKKRRRRTDDGYLQEGLEQLLEVLQAARDGDFSARARVETNGTFGAVAATLNELIARNEQLTHELGRVCKVVGRDGDVDARASLDGARGSWAATVDSVNTLISDTAWRTNEFTRVITAVAQGDFSQMIELRHGEEPLRGAFHRMGTTVNG